MLKLTPAGQKVVDDLALRHDFSREAILHLLAAVRDGAGDMAMFSHPEFGGPGQWMRGGLLMLSDGEDYLLRGRVDALCHELAAALRHPPALLDVSEEEGGWPVAEAVPDADPAGLGTPTASGAQNGTRYAYYAEARRLVVQSGGTTRVYDTQDHRIQGIAQRQGETPSLTFTSQHGSVDLASLPLVSDQPGADAASASQGAIFAALERLGELRAKGILSEEEFAAKKAELLARL